jgi:hypothetical protein
MRRGTFANLLSARRGWPIKVHNRRTLQCQMQCEGGSAENNPFNTTQRMPRSTFYNVLQRDGSGRPLIGVQNYATPEEGLDALEMTFDAGDHRYAAVEAALKANRPARVTVPLIGISPWGTASALLVEVLSWISRVPGVLRLLERKEIAS